MPRTIGYALRGIWVLLLYSSVAAQTYTVTDLGVLPGDIASAGVGVNSAGQVVGCSDTSTLDEFPCEGDLSGQHAFLWSAGTGMIDLGTLSGGSISGASGINDSDEVVGYSQNAQGEFGFVWTQAGGMVLLQGLAGDIGSGASAVNSSGVVAGFSLKPDFTADAVLWNRKGTIQNIGSLPGGVFSDAIGINDKKHVVGESILSFGPPLTTRGFVWTKTGGMKQLRTLPGGTTSVGIAINSAGVIAGRSDAGKHVGVTRAVMWDEKRKITNLGTLRGGSSSAADGINDAGQIVGDSTTSKGASHAILWTSANGMQDLNRLIPRHSGWVLITAEGINQSGQITGYGTIAGQNHAFLLTPKSGRGSGRSAQGQ